MNAILDVASPMMVLEELAVQLLPTVLWVLLVVLLLGVSVAGIRFALKKLRDNADKTAQSEATDVSEK